MSHRDRRAIAFGLLTIVTAWLAFRGVPAMAAKADAMEEGVAQRNELLTRVLARLSTIPALTDSLARLEQIADSLPMVLLASGESMEAHADLMDRVRTVIEPLPATIQGFGSVDTEASAGPLRSAAVDVTIDSDFAGVIQLVEALDLHPALVIEEVQIDAVEVDEVTTDVELLRVRVRVRGWYRPTDIAREVP